MTMFDAIKDKNIDELADWLAANCLCDTSPWYDWFTKKYCEKCLSIPVFVPLLDRETDCAYCEVNKKCRFFPQLEENIPEDKNVIKMWLESEVNNA